MGHPAKGWGTHSARLEDFSQRSQVALEAGKIFFQPFGVAIRCRHLPHKPQDGIEGFSRGTLVARAFFGIVRLERRR